MRIKGSELRKIIKEEIGRISMREAQEVALEPGAEMAPAAVNPPAAEMPAALRPKAARFPAFNLIIREIPEYYREILKLSIDPDVRKQLNDLYTGRSGEILELGDSGPVVKIYQAIVFANLTMWYKAHTSLASKEGPSGFRVDPIKVANKSIDTNGNITDEELADAIFKIIMMSPSSMIDGSYGPMTRAAVALLQTVMDRQQIIASAFGSQVNWDAAIDGKIGRQTAQFLAGFTKLGAITGVDAK